MFKNLHSNRDPRDTLLSEVKKEFSGHFQKAGKGFANYIDRWPKLMFGVMIALMVLSIGLALTVFRPRPPVTKHLAKSSLSPITDGVSEVFRIGDQIKETIGLKKMVDTLSKKKTLTAKDSLMLEKALDRLDQIKQSVKP